MRLYIKILIFTASILLNSMSKYQKFYLTKVIRTVYEKITTAPIIRGNVRKLYDF